ncbi:carbohydrate ABC transporter permease [Microbacterium sp.]|uniref:carbohydrate ABC transporter permease n=1 Tax=Microbacterium sp. TaxID=51671 RepID=UPI001AD0EC62|nr:sugar ABC transporter permease [Microbacterium sp.]MBN9186523.1 sugar ABC transporter permease [Microbacterium sp.]MBN9194219.1 sugar ABC transporter permease [Microbacterium sp.]
MGKRRMRKYSSIGTLALFLGPSLLIIALLRVWPVIQGAFIAFTQWDGIRPPVFNGLDNFTRMLSDPVLLTALGNTGKILILAPVWIILPLLLAAVIQDRIPGASFFKISYVLPVLVSPAVIGVLFVIILGPDGPLNIVLRGIGLGALAINWTVDTTLVMWIVAGMLIWSTFGLGVLLFSAGLASIDESLYEAARIDGANWMQRFWYVTVPSVRGVIEYWTVMVVIMAFSSAIVLGYSFSQGGPGYASTTVDLFIYNQAFRYGAPGYATAIGITLFLLIGILLVIFLRVSRRRGELMFDDSGTPL